MTFSARWQDKHTGDQVCKPDFRDVLNAAWYCRLHQPDDLARLDVLVRTEWDRLIDDRERARADALAGGRRQRSDAGPEAEFSRARQDATERLMTPSGGKDAKERKRKVPSAREVPLLVAGRRVPAAAEVATRVLRAALDRARRHYELADYPQTEAELTAALRLGEAPTDHEGDLGPPSLVASMFVTLGLARLADGGELQAREAFSKAIDFFERAGLVPGRWAHAEPEPVAHELGDLGIALAAVGRPKEAIDLLRAATRLGEPCPRSLATSAVCSWRASKMTARTSRRPRGFFASGATESSRPDCDAAACACPRSLWGCRGGGGELSVGSRGMAERGRYADAAELFDEALRVDRHNISALANKAELSRQRGELISAIGMADDVLRLDDSDARPYVTKAAALLDLGEAAEALLWADRAASHGARRPVVSQLRALSYMSLDNIDEAIAELRAGLKDAPDWFWGIVMVGELLRLSGRPHDAQLELERAVALQPDSGFAVGTLGQVLLDLDDVAPAITALRRAVELDPDGDWTQASLAEALLRVGAADEALVAAERALAINPDMSDALAVKASVLLPRGEIQTVIELASEHLARFPDWYVGRGILGNALRLREGEGDLETARELLEDAVEAAPDDATFHANLGAVLYEMNELDEALEALDSALELEAHNAWAREIKGAVLARKGLWDEATVELRRSVEEDPEPMPPHYRLGECFRATGNLEDSLTELDEALEREPDNPVVLGSKGLVLRLSGRLDEARAILHRALEQQPDDLTIQSELGEVLRVVGEYADARPFLEGVLEADSSDNWSRASLGATFTSLGEYDKAAALLDEAIAQDPDYVFALCKNAELCARYRRSREPRNCSSAALRPMTRQTAGYTGYLAGVASTWDDQETRWSITPKRPHSIPTPSSIVMARPARSLKQVIASRPSGSIGRRSGLRSRSVRSSATTICSSSAGRTRRSKTMTKRRGSCEQSWRTHPTTQQIGSISRWRSFVAGVSNWGRTNITRP